MRSTRIALLSLVLGLVSAHPAPADDTRPLLAVYPTIRGPEVADPAKHGLDAQEVTRSLEEGVRATRRFRLYERNADVLKAVREEQDFALSERAARNAAQFGKLNRVSYIVQPFISEFRFGSSFGEVNGLPGKYNRNDSGALVVVFKVLDTTTGEIKYQMTSKSDFVHAAGYQDVKAGGPGFDSWKRMVDEACRRGAEGLADTIWPIKVVRYEESQLFLNRGEGGGVAVGEAWTVFAVGEVMRDPDTHAELGRAEFPIGRVRVFRVTPRFSVAQPIGELKQAPKEGDVLRKN